MKYPEIPATGHRFLTTWRFLNDPYLCYRQWKQRYGNTFLVNALNGDVVATCDPENIRRAFAAAFEDVEPFAVGTIRPLVGGNSVFLLQGDRHRRERSILSPPFQGSAMKSQFGVIEQAANEVSYSWQTGQTVRIMDAALDLSLEVIIRIVFGIESRDQIHLYMAEIKEFVASFRPIFAFTRIFQRSWFGLSPWNRFVRSRDTFWQLLMDQISHARQHGCPEGTVLNHLINAEYEDGGAASDKSIRDQLVSMLLAGHETTQIAIAWGMSWLHRSADVLQRLRSEIDSLTLPEVIDSPLLQGVCNESLRLNAIVPDTVRTLKVPLEWQELTLPRGSNIALSICMVHENPELYPEPMRFNPDRWLGKTYKPHEFMPFGGGVRRCIGAPLALLEMKIVIATWLRNFRFELPNDAPSIEPIHRRNITMAPKTGIPLSIVERLQA